MSKHAIPQGNSPESVYPFTSSIGPRVPGGRYRSHHWGEEYTVEKLVTTLVWRDGKPEPSQWFVQVRWARDGQTSIHSTAWDDRDCVIEQPARSELCEVMA